MKNGPPKKKLAHRHFCLKIHRLSDETPCIYCTCVIREPLVPSPGEERCHGPHRPKRHTARAHAPMSPPVEGWYGPSPFLSLSLPPPAPRQGMENRASSPSASGEVEPLVFSVAARVVVALWVGPPPRSPARPPALWCGFLALLQRERTVDPRPGEGCPEDRSRH